MHFNVYNAPLYKVHNWLKRSLNVENNFYIFVSFFNCCLQLDSFAFLWLQVDIVLYLMYLFLVWYRQIAFLGRQFRKIFLHVEYNFFYLVLFTCCLPGHKPESGSIILYTLFRHNIFFVIFFNKDITLSKFSIISLYVSQLLRRQNKTHLDRKWKVMWQCWEGRWQYWKVKYWYWNVM